MPDYKVPYSFIAGTRARASQVNANFEYLVDAANTLSAEKANINGNAAINFSVAEPTAPTHAVTKRYVDLAIENSGGSGGSGGSGVGKSLFEVFHTLSTATPPGAFSLRTGDLLTDAENLYPTFWGSLIEQSKGLIPDFTDVTTLPEDYSATFTSIVSSENLNRVFSPYSWVTSNSAPTNVNPIAAELVLPELVSCRYFKVNSHVFDTYNSTGTADAQKAIKTASISVRKSDGTWVPVVIIEETELPTSNERYYESSNPEIAFDAIRIVVAENFGSLYTDISIYPVNPDVTTVRVVPEEQWQWEVSHYGETGAFVQDRELKTVRLPKVNGFLNGVYDLWEVGMPTSISAGSSSATSWEDNENAAEEGKVKNFNVMRTGLWIQIYNTVAEDAISNIKYIPHATLFEERTFRFVPAIETGWAVSEGLWFDGHYYIDAIARLLEYQAQAVAIPGEEYTLAPNGMRFVSESVYETTLETYGEVPYYVVDSENYRFKTPSSTNYVRCTNTADNLNELQLDAAPNITGLVPGTEGNASSIAGAFYRDSQNTQQGYSDDETLDNDVFGFDASRSSSVYGRANEIRVKSSIQLLCVFLGNEVPQSAAVDVFKRIYANQEAISEANEHLTAVDGQLVQVDQRFGSQQIQIAENASAITEVASDVAEVSNSVVTVRDDITLLQDKDAVIDLQIEGLTGSTEYLKGTTDSLISSVAAVEESLEEKQVKLIAGEGIILDEEGNISVAPSEAPTNMVTVDTEQTITGLKSFSEPVSIQDAVISNSEDAGFSINVSKTASSAVQNVVVFQTTLDSTGASGSVAIEEPEFIFKTVDTQNGISVGEYSTHAILKMVAGDGVSIEQNKSVATISVDTSSFDAYTKTEVDDLLSSKISTSDLSTELETVQSKLDLKADKTSVESNTSAISSLDSRLGGLTFVKLTQAEYDLLETKDENTLYVIIE